MKKVSIIIMIVIGVASIYTSIQNENSKPKVKQMIENGYKTSEATREELYRDICVLQLHPYIIKEVEKYYGQGTRVNPSDVKILGIQRPEGDKSFLFTLRLEVLPYQEPRMEVGADRITIRVSSQDVRVESYEHAKSYSHIDRTGSILKP